MLKLYILARKDAPIGKVMAHIGHVCCEVITKAQMPYDQINKWYYENDQTKIVLSVDNEAYLIEWIKKVIGSVYVVDVHTGEIYCVAIGPITDDEAKELGLKELGLFKI